MMEFKDKDGNITHTLTDEGLISRIGTVSPETKLWVVPTQSYKFHEPHPNSILFYNGAPDNTEVLRISKEGVWANPDIPPDEAAQAVLRVMDGYIKQMVERVRSEEREACAKVCEQLWDYPENGMATEEEHYGNKCADHLRARGRV